MIGLKTYAPILAHHLNLTADAVYERQRVLVRSGYLVGTAGRGPGSGVRADASSVAKLVISALATDLLADLDEKTRQLAGRKPEGDRCSLTGKSNFLAALTELLSAPDDRYRFNGHIAVDRKGMWANIVWHKPNRKLPSNQYFGRGTFEAHEGLSITAQLWQWDVRSIALELSEISNGSPVVHPNDRELGEVR